MGVGEDGLTVEVGYDNEGEVVIDFQSAVLGTLTLDYENAPEGERVGNMRRLLCASAAGCYVWSVRDALTSRGATVRSCRGSGTLRATEGHRIGRIDIRVEVAIGEDEDEILDHVRKILHGGCLVTQALARCMDVNHEIVKVEG